MRVKDLPPSEQAAIRECFRFVLEGRALAGEFETRLGVGESDVRALLQEWPDVDDVRDESVAVLAINNVFNEVCHGVRVRDWNRWFSRSPEEMRLSYRRWAEGRGWTGPRPR